MARRKVKRSPGNNRLVLLAKVLAQHHMKLAMDRKKGQVDLNEDIPYS